jgi:signal transduction histidine kinase
VRVGLGPVLMPVVVWALVLAAQRRGVPDPAFRLDDLQLVDPDPSTPAAELVSRKGLSWCLTATPGRTHFTLRHRFTTAPAAARERFGLNVPSVERNLEAFLNGTKIGDGGRFEPYVERNRHRPLFLSIPAALLRPGENTLDLRVVGVTFGDTFLQPVYLGPHRLLEPAYHWQYAFKVTSMQMIVVTLLLMALFIGALWVKRPRETVYAWFAAGLLCWTLQNLNYLLTGWPVGQPGWQTVIHAALGAYLYCMILFVHRLVGIRPERGERALAWITVLSVGLLLLSAWVIEPTRLWWLINCYRWIPLSLGAYLLARLGALCLQRRTPALYWLASACLLTLSFGVHDTLRLTEVLDPTVPNLNQYGSLAALLVFGYLLVDRFAAALRESEELNVILDGKVQRKTQELEAQFGRTRDLEREMVLAQERERLVRDMHDGMGGQLVSLLNLVRSGRVDPHFLEEAVAECLQDLRLVIDSMDTAGEDLVVGLGMLRSRLEPRLRAMGLVVHWDTHRLPEGIGLGPEGVLQVFRILQEALQNAIKHSQARTLWIEAQADGTSAAPAVRLTVRDDGVGLAAVVSGGRGLVNMRWRAERLGATLTVDAAHPGTRVTLSLPTPPSS